MSVIVADANNPAYDGNLSTANGFYRAEAENMGGFSTSVLSLSSTRTVAFTPANAGNAQGVSIPLQTTSNVNPSSSMADVTINLQEQTSPGVWTTRATKTLTAEEISNNMPGSGNGAVGGIWAPAFRFVTPYAITAVAATWRIEISNTGGTNWDLRTSDATNPMYVLWCDNQVSYTDNTDQIIIVDPITIDMSATFKGKLGTGNATHSVCGWACRNTDPTPANVCNLVWENPPASSYTVNFDGLFYWSAHSGMRVGTEADPIPKAEEAIINTIAATSGTSTITGFSGFNYTGSATVPRKSSFFFYGEVAVEPQVTTLTYPAVHGGVMSFTIASPCVATKAGTLPGAVMMFSTTGALPTGITAGTDYFAGNVSGSTFNLYNTYANAIAGGATGRVNTSGTQSGVHTANTVIITDDVTGWAINDPICSGRQNTTGSSDRVVNTIATISGNRITVNTNFVTANRLIGAPIVRLNGHGITFQGYSQTTAPILNMFGPTNFVLSGVSTKWIGWTLGTAQSGGRAFDSLANTTTQVIQDATMWASDAGAVNLVSFLTPEHYSPTLQRIYIQRAGMSVQTVAPITFPAPTISELYIMTPSSNPCTFDMNNMIIDQCQFHQSAATFLTQGRANVTFTDNLFWGCSQASGALSLSNFFFQNTNSNGNMFANNLVGLGLTGTIVAGYSADDLFGTAVTNGLANTTDIDINTTGAETYQQMLFDTPRITTLGTSLLASSLIGTTISFINYNNSTGDDRVYLTNGEYQKTGSGLTDTTARTAGGYAIRLKPTSGTERLSWPVLSSQRIIPTGDIQNKTMTITAWIDINNTAYDAGTHVMPTMRIKYDNATTVDAVTVATFGSWQQIATSFTPTTTYGQVELWFSGATDATGSNAYFYIDDINVAYPAGVIVNNGPLDAWANAVPVWPPTASIANQTNFWDELKANHTVSGSFGEGIAATEIEAKNFLAGDKMEGA